MNALRIFGLSLVALVACGGDPDPASRLSTFRTVAMRATRVVQSDTCDVGLVPAADARPGVAPKLGKTNCDVSGSYAHPGDEVQLELLWHDPNPEGTRSWAWTTCLNPPSTSVFGCFQKLAQDLAQLPPDKRQEFFLGGVKLRPPTLAKAFEGNELATDPKADPRTLFRVKVPADAFKEFEGLDPLARRGATMGVVFLACPGRLEPNLDAARNALPFKCLGASGEELGSDKFTIGIKRLFLRDKDNNEDPRIDAVLFDGAPWAADDVKVIKPACNGDEARFDRCSDPKHALTVQLRNPFEEKGTDETGQSFEEQVVVQYYATEGLFEFDLKRAEDPKTKFAGRRGKVDPAAEQRMWIVIRDNRGGVSWVMRRFRVVP